MKTFLSKEFPVSPINDTERSLLHGYVDQDTTKKNNSNKKTTHNLIPILFSNLQPVLFSQLTTL